jgi:hypothetical protein
LPVAGVDRSAERVELAAGVVDDPLDKNVVTAETHRVGERRPDRHRAALHDDERSSGVRAAKFQRYAQPVSLRSSKAGALAQNSIECGMPDHRSEPQIDEPRHRLDAAEDASEFGSALRYLGDEFGCEVLRRAARRFRQREGEIA